MTTPTSKFYPSALLEKDDLEQRLEKKLNDVNSFNNSISNNKEKITNFKNKIYKKKEIQKVQNFNHIIKIT